MLDLTHIKTPHPTVALTQAGELLAEGPGEHCEEIAKQHRGLYCWMVDGAAVIRRDYEDYDEDDDL